MAKLKKSKELVILIVVTGIMFVSFCAILLALWQQNQRLQNENIALKEDVAELEHQLEFYMHAYATTIDDIRQLTRIFGGEKEYEEHAEELRKTELMLYNISENSTGAIMKADTAWRNYTLIGVINTSCLPEKQVLDTITDNVLVSVEADADDTWLQLFLDANYLATFNVEGETYDGVEIEMPPGTHELFLYAEEPVSVNAIRLDTYQVDLSQTILDEGEDWDALDCRGTRNSTVLLQSGAIRMLVEKQ